jgi:hypothetical protein
MHYIVVTKAETYKSDKGGREEGMIQFAEGKSMRVLAWKELSTWEHRTKIALPV